MQPSDAKELTRREREIAAAYAGGASYRDIGTRLFIAPATVRTHIGTIYRKLGVSSKIALLRTLEHAGTAATLAVEEVRAVPGRRASIAIMPFQGACAQRGALAQGLVQDIIAGLAKLRAVRVTARGSVFTLAERGIADHEAGRLLGVDYLATGSVTGTKDRVSIAVQLVETRSGDILWAERFNFGGPELFEALDQIGLKIVGALASEIEISERNRALLNHPESLGAWASFHRGLWHMYRFTREDNDRAQALFREAADMDPTYARAHAGLSFTHFQNAFLLRPQDRQQEAERALKTAGLSLAADERDPTAHWAMGRALWLAGSDGGAVSELRTSVDLSPSFSMGHYALAFVTCQSGDAEAAVTASDHARELSPFDPLLFGMLGARAMALFRLGAFEGAADAAVSAASRPNAHVHIQVIAALCLAAANRLELARSYAAIVHRNAPGYRIDDFFTAFRFPLEVMTLYRKQADLIGL
ncbi:LuxR C-terminal-related transcriptional regulator [Aurantimonas sp. HBX-1]|uniref:LuxR C-terminal-related transcriptional regulator n=1 Tax=Aurantimonas sp. HBX-1 TaxID=2906072 RepID=UPI001F2E57DE|nr:LuxR C-terminal-related transcriptional regulator [Aurantimonas sp. HBX-1]UIJ70427.1 LuxR C-terminal-related transcriptional regulator [Aurantimonas sp. HBX-1]